MWVRQFVGKVYLFKYIGSPGSKTEEILQDLKLKKIVWTSSTGDHALFLPYAYINQYSEKRWFRYRVNISYATVMFGLKSVHQSVGPLVDWSVIIFSTNPAI